MTENYKDMRYYNIEGILPEITTKSIDEYIPNKYYYDLIEIEEHLKNKNGLNDYKCIWNYPATKMIFVKKQYLSSKVKPLICISNLNEFDDFIDKCFDEFKHIQPRYIPIILTFIDRQILCTFNKIDKCSSIDNDIYSNVNDSVPDYLINIYFDVKGADYYLKTFTS